MGRPKKLPHDAFNYYVSLGVSRTYTAVAKHLGLTIQTVVLAAKKEKWKDRVAKLEARAQEKSEARLEESIEQMNRRHIASLRRIHDKAIKTLQALPIESAMDAVRAIGMVIKQERLIRGEATERAEISIEAIIRREYERWLGPGEVEVVEEGEVETIEERKCGFPEAHLDAHA